MPIYTAENPAFSVDPPAEPVGVTDKMGIDATAKPNLDRFAPKNRIPKEVMERIRLEDYVGKDFQEQIIGFRESMAFPPLRINLAFV